MTDHPDAASAPLENNPDMWFISERAGVLTLGPVDMNEGDRFEVMKSADVGPDLGNTIALRRLPRPMTEDTVSRPDPRAERAFADALVEWYDTTHGNEFGHDHHCLVRDDRGATFTAKPDERCICGWSDVLRTDNARAALEGAPHD